MKNRLARQAPCTLPHWLRSWSRRRGPPGGYPSSATVTLTSPAMSWPRRGYRARPPLRADYRRNGPAASWRSSPRFTPRSCWLRALVAQGYGSRSCRSLFSAQIRPEPSACGPVPGAASPGPGGKHATSFSASPQPTRTQDTTTTEYSRSGARFIPAWDQQNHDRPAAPTPPGLPSARPSATGPGTPPVLSQPEPGIEAILGHLQIRAFCAVQPR